MTVAPPGPEILRTKLCPWLRPALSRLLAAYGEQRLGHAWLITGTAGIGKINLALVLADRLLHGSGIADEPAILDRAATVAAIASRHAPVDHHPDLHWLYPEEDKASISVEQVRGVIDALGLTAYGGGAKVVIVEPAEAMTVAAANALLKTLEEPADDTYLLLLSHQPGRLTATIRSRCQRLTLPAPGLEACREWLGEIDASRLLACWQATGGAPLTAAALIEDNNYININSLTSDIALISEDRSDPSEAAARWAAGAPAIALAWLMRQIHAEIRRRFDAAVSTPVTDQRGSMLHNPCVGLSLRELFEQYDRAEKLLGQVDSGINLELALQALFVGFQVNRGRS